MYKTDIKNVAKRLRATTSAIKKLKERGLYRKQYGEEFNRASKIILHFGCTNIIFANYTYMFVYIVFINILLL